MSNPRRRWTPLRGRAFRVYDPRERVLLRAFDIVVSLLVRAARLVPWGQRDSRTRIERVIVFRLDRIGDVVMSLPALAQLRAALPEAFITLVVGRWSTEIARSAPVDEVLVWSAPWVGRASEGAESLWRLARRARRMRVRAFDLAIDLQGDIRAALLMYLTSARERVGYANTGGACLLTRVVALDEEISWVDQNRAAVKCAVGREAAGARVALLTAEESEDARRLLVAHGLSGRRPLVGIHPSGGRLIKQWDLGCWRGVAGRLAREQGATIVVTGSGADRPLAAAVAEGLTATVDLTGRLGLREMLALISELDLFLSSDTGPMHLACALGTPTVSLFGPSDPRRYFSGTPSASHVVVAPELWCAPCNLIRRPPDECRLDPPPECLRSVSVEAVYAHAVAVLRAGRQRGPEIH
jgi:ADP-heptose:LPS heptosyltransferase